MHKTIREYVKHELSNYQYYKTTLNSITLQSLLTYKQQLWLNIVVQGIENALATLPKELRRYVQLRYFQKTLYTNSGLATHLNISERTLRKWDQLLIHSIAKQIGIFYTPQNNT